MFYTKNVNLLLQGYSVGIHSIMCTRKLNGELAIYEIRRHYTCIEPFGEWLDSIAT